MGETAYSVGQWPTKSATQSTVSAIGIVPIATGGLPSATGAIGNPSGVTAVYRLAKGMGITRLAAGKYEVTFAPAPNGVFRAWVELSPLNTFSDVSVVARDTATGYVDIQCYNASGAKIDPANGDVLAFEFIGFSTGKAAGP